MGCYNDNGIKIDDWYEEMICFWKFLLDGRPLPIPEGETENYWFPDIETDFFNCKDPTDIAHEHFILYEKKAEQNSKA